MDLNLKKKELWFFILSVFILGGELGLATNILFTEFYVRNKIIFISIVLFVLILTVYLIIKVMFNYDKKTYSTDMMFVYNINQKEFINIPYSPSSVNAKIVFNNLNKSQLEKIQIEDLSGLRNKEFHYFCLDAVAHIVISRFIKHRPYKEKVDIEKLKDIVLKYRYIDVDFTLNGEGFRVKQGDKYHKIEGKGLTLPEGFKIESKDRKTITLKSAYGIVNFDWEVFVTTDTSRSTLLSTFENIDLSNCLEVSVKVKLEYGFNAFKLFKKNTLEFNNFIENCKQRMDNFDFVKSKQKYQNDIISNFKNYIDEKFDSLKG